MIKTFQTYQSLCSWGCRASRWKDKLGIQGEWKKSETKGYLGDAVNNPRDLFQLEQSEINKLNDPKSNADSEAT